jgi:CRP/FNR family transcriptional regulator
MNSNDPLTALTAWRDLEKKQFTFLTSSTDSEKGKEEVHPTLMQGYFYPADMGLFQQGFSPYYVYFIERGLVKLSRVEQDGQQVIIGLRSTGWLLGASSVILQNNYTASATTLTPCHLRRISSEAFLHLLKTDVQFSWHIQQAQSREAYEQVSKITELSCLSARTRLERLLWCLISSLGSDHTQSEVKIEVPLKQLEIAQLIGVTAEHFCRMLKQMEVEGMLQRKKGWLIIKEPQKLCRSDVP